MTGLKYWGGGGGANCTPHHAPAGTVSKMAYLQPPITEIFGEGVLPPYKLLGGGGGGREPPMLHFLYL